MARNADEVIAGVGLWYAAPVGTAAPTTNDGALNAAFRELGYTEEGGTITTETTVEPIEVAEELEPIKYVNGARAATVSLTLVQASIENIALALNLGADFSPTALSVSPPDAGDEESVALVLQTPQDARWYFPSAKNGGTFEMARTKTGKTGIAVSFQIEKVALTPLFTIFANDDGLI